MARSSKFQPSPCMREHIEWVKFARQYQIEKYPGINPIFPVPSNMLDEINSAFAEAYK